MNVKHYCKSNTIRTLFTFAIQDHSPFCGCGNLRPHIGQNLIPISAPLGTSICHRPLSSVWMQVSKTPPHRLEVYKMFWQICVFFAIFATTQFLHRYAMGNKVGSNLLKVNVLFDKLPIVPSINFDELYKQLCQLFPNVHQSAPSFRSPYEQKSSGLRLNGAAVPMGWSQ